MVKAEQKQDKKHRKRRRWRRRRVVSYLILFFLLSVIGVFAYLTHPYRVAQLAKQILEEQTGAHVTLDGARFELDGTIRLYGVDMRVPDIPGKPNGGHELFNADQILIEHELLSLLSGKINVQSVHFTRPTFYPTEDVDSGRFTFQYLKPLRKAKDKKSVGRLPTINIQAARVVFGEIADGKYTPLESIQLSGQVSDIPEQIGEHTFALRHHDASDKLAITGQFNLQNQSVRARVRVETLTKDDRRLRLLPRAIRQFMKEWQPTGEVSTFEFAYDREHELQATIAIKDAGLYAPWGATTMQVTNASGTFLVKANQVDLRLKGKAKGIPFDADFEMNGHVDGLSIDAPMNASIELSGFIPDNPENLHLLPERVQNLVDLYKFSGRFLVNAQFERDVIGGTIISHGHVVLINGKAKYRHFPYPIEKVDASAYFDNEHVHIEKLTAIGKPDENGESAAIEVTGKIIAPGRTAGIDLDVTITDGPITDTFFKAIPGGHGKHISQFFDPEAFARLSKDEDGVIQSSKQKAQRQEKLAKLLAQLNTLPTVPATDVPKNIANATPETKALAAQIETIKQRIARPVCDLGGKVNITAKVLRTPGERQVRLEIDVVNKNVTALYRNWPYPLVAQSGSLHVKIPTEIYIKDVRLAGLTGGELTINGDVLPTDGNHSKLTPRLQIKAKQLPLDSILIAALPKSSGDIINSLAINGAVDAEGTVDTTPQGDARYTFKTQVNNATANPNNGKYDLRELNAKLTIKQDSVRVDQLTAKHGKDTTISLAGGPDPDKANKWSFAISGKNLQFDEPVSDLIPPDMKARQQILQLQQQYLPRGKFDFNLALNLQDTDFNLDIRPHDLRFKLNNTQLYIENRDTKSKSMPVTVTAKGVTFNDFQFQFVGLDHKKFVQPDANQPPAKGMPTQRATGHVRGSIATDSSQNIDLHFGIKANTICDGASALLPKAVVSALSVLELTGGYDLQNAHLLQLATKSDTKAGANQVAADSYTSTFKGTILWNNAKAHLGVPITKLNGKLDVNVTAEPDKVPQIDLLLRDASLYASDRLISPIQVAITNGDQAGEILIKELKGKIYKGTLTGQGRVWEKDDEHHYRLALAMQEATLDHFLNPKKVKPLTGNKTPETKPAKKAGSNSDANANIKADTSAKSSPNTSVVRKTEAMLSASLSLEGTAGKDAKRQGRGEIHVRNASLYETPVGFAVLQLMNLTPPISSSFNRVDASYAVDGDLIHIRKLNFLAPTLSITGAGTLRYSTQQLNLAMTSANPQGLKLGFITDVLKLLRDELASIRVTGTLSNPKASVVPLSGVQKAVDNVIGKPNSSQDK